MGRSPHALLLVSHGSRDPRAATVTGALAGAVTAARPGLTVGVAGLEHALPRPGAALAELAAAGCRSVTVVPLLLAAAYHATVDLPAALAAARDRLPRLDIRLSDVLGPDDRLVDGVRQRLTETPDGHALDALVLAAAGTKDQGAVATIAATAHALGSRTGLPCRDGYASAAKPTVAEAVSALRTAGARRVGVAAYFLAPGFLYDKARAEAVTAGAVAVAPPLGVAPELVDVLLARYDAACPDGSAVRDAA